MITGIRYLVAVFLIFMASSSFSQDTIYQSDTLIRGDTTHIHNTVTIISVDTINVYDTSVAIQRQSSDVMDRLYEKATEALDHRMTMITMLLAIIGIIIIVIGYIAYRYHREINKEIDRVEKAAEKAEQQIKECREKLERDAEKMRAEMEKEHARLLKDISDHLKESKAALERIQKQEVEADKGLAKIEKTVQKAQAIAPFVKLPSVTEQEELRKESLSDSLHKKTGMNYYRQEIYDKAVNEFLIYLASNPADEEITFYVANAYGESGRNADAASYYEKVTKLNPENSYAYSNWCAVLTRLYEERKDAGLLEEAIEKLKKALEINPEDYRAYTNWGTSLLLLYREHKDPALLEEAHKKATKAIEINAQYAGGYYNKACVISLSKRKKEMLLSLKTAIDCDPKSKALAREDRDFQEYWDDADFIALTKENDD